MKRHTLLSLLGIAALSLTLPFAGPAAAGGSGKAKSAKSKASKTKPAKTCKGGGKGYEVQGLLLEGSSLGQVAGAATTRRSDDRWAGTLIVKVQQGNKRGRADRGTRTYEVTGVRVRGTDGGELPVAGARVSLAGKVAGTKCAGAAAVRIEKVGFKPAEDAFEDDEAEGSDDDAGVEDEAPEEEPPFDDSDEQPADDASGDDFFAGKR